MAFCQRILSGLYSVSLSHFVIISKNEEINQDPDENEEELLETSRATLAILESLRIGRRIEL